MKYTCGRAARLLLSVALGAAGAKGQSVTRSGDSLSAAACTLSGQLPEQAFDPQMVEFVSDLVPVGDAAGFRVRMIARVVGVRPLVIEVLDSDVADQGGLRCELRRIHSADARLRDILPQLRFNDLVQTSMVLAQGGTGALVLTAAEKIQGEPAFFHARADESVCSNRTGTLVAYRQPNGESTTVYKDGAISYRDAHATVFDRQALGQEDLARLMQTFQGAEFNVLANSMPAVDRTHGQASITLICARHQRVLLSGNQPALVPLIQSLELVKAKALADTVYRLTYDEKREITFLSWPFPQLPVSQAGSRIREAAQEEFDARCAVRLVRGDYRRFHQELPREFFTKLPVAYSKSPDADPNRDAYVRSGSRVYRVTWSTCGDDGPDCKNLYQLSRLSVDEVLTPENRMKLIPDRTPPAREIGCSSLAGIRSLLWPSSAGLALRSVPRDGQAVTSAGFARDEHLYRELLAAASCGNGIDFVEGAYWYRNVRMVHVDRAASSR
jgi:hypothetical protein